MKLLVQSDDYGITLAQAHGCIEAIKNGIVRNTGLFANMPWAKECVELIKPYLNTIAFGIDLNASTGPSLLSKNEITSLIHDDEVFLTSKENKELDTKENNFDHVVYEEVYKEFEAQIHKYIELVGKNPDYIHGHAYGTDTTNKAILNLAKKYQVPYSMDVAEKMGCSNMNMGWYNFPPTLENQLNSNLESYILEDKFNFLDEEYGFLVCHVGFLDKQIFDLSSFNIYRVVDFEGVTSPKVKEWISKNKVELITYKDVLNLLD